MKETTDRQTKALALGGGGLTGLGWEMGLLVGLAEAGIDGRLADMFIGTSAGSNVAAIITSGLTMDELFQRLVHPDTQTKELFTQPDFQQIIADYTRVIEEGGSSTEILRRMGALALSSPTVAESKRREVIVARLPVPRWPQTRLEIVAVDAFSGERIVFNRESGVDLVDAVAASCALPCVWPPVTIDGHRYIDGGCYSMANADLAAGFDKVLVLQPDVPSHLVMENLDEQIERLRLHGTQVEVITSNEAMKLALASAGGNTLDPSLLGIVARIGREQAASEAARVAAFWG